MENLNFAKEIEVKVFSVSGDNNGDMYILQIHLHSLKEWQRKHWKH